MKNYCKKRIRASVTSGFTLIELLVVMGIIGLLLGLLFPAINKAKEMAYKNEQVNLIREFNTASRMYKQEFQRYPWPLPRQNIVQYDPKPEGTAKAPKSEDIVRTLSPDNSELYYPNPTSPTCYVPATNRSYINIPAKFIEIPNTGVNRTCVDMWRNEFRFLTDPETLDPVVYSVGLEDKDGDGRLDDSWDEYFWNDDGDGRVELGEMAHPGTWGDDIPRRGN